MDDPPSYQEHRQDYSPGITVQDAYALKKNATLLQCVSPEMRWSYGRANYKDKRTYLSSFVGVWPDIMEMEGYEIEFGRFFSPYEDHLAKNVCVIGADIRDSLFGPTNLDGSPLDPVGKKININYVPFQIIGMYKKMENEAERRKREYQLQQQQSRSGPTRSGSFGRSSRYDPYWRRNNVAHIPLNTMWMKFRMATSSASSSIKGRFSTSGSSEPEVFVPDPKLSDFDVKALNVDVLDKAMGQIRNVMVRSHNGIQDFSFRTQESVLTNINKRLNSAQIIRGIIATFSLIVVGIVIMIIMLAFVNFLCRNLDLISK